MKTAKKIKPTENLDVISDDDDNDYKSKSNKPKKAKVVVF